MALLPVIAGMSLAATAAAGAVSAWGQMRGGAARQQMLNYQAAVARINAKHAIDVGEAEAQRSGMRTRAQLGQIEAAQGASNIDVNSGSGLLVRKSQMALGYLDEQTIRNNAAWRAYSDRTQATLYTAAGKEAKTAGNIAAIGTILGTVGSVAGKWMGASSAFGTTGATADPGVRVYNEDGSAGAIY